MVCTFFGHRDTPETIAPILKKVLIELIENENAGLFYVGNNGNFDAIAYRTLKLLADEYKIRYYVVSPYVASEKDKHCENLIVADGCETVPKGFAVIHRNRWMLRQSDIVITFVRYPSSGAASFRDLAVKQSQKIIDL